MLTVTIVNKQTEPIPKGDYRIEVSINHQAVWIGDVTGHLREDGWLALLEAAVEAMKEDSK